jgi:hypothetical protein
VHEKQFDLTVGRVQLGLRFPHISLSFLWIFAFDQVPVCNVPTKNRLERFFSLRKVRLEVLQSDKYLGMLNFYERIV